MVVAIAALLFLNSDNTLSRSESRAGWKLLFDGKTTHGWHNFKIKGVGPGWVIEDGVLTSADPDKAGDIVTDQKFDWFELTLDFRLTTGGNSGIMFRVADKGEASWHSGPEIQIYDDQGAKGAQKSGWLYQLYSSPVDTTHPPGEWNHVRILVAPEKCETDMNGTKYYEYVYGNKDFWDRVAKSKFAKYPEFAKADSGSIGLQGDHGVVSFKNVKIRRLKASRARHQTDIDCSAR